MILSLTCTTFSVSIQLEPHLTFTPVCAFSVDTLLHATTIVFHTLIFIYNKSHKVESLYKNVHEPKKNVRKVFVCNNKIKYFLQLIPQVHVLICHMENTALSKFLVWLTKALSVFSLQTQNLTYFKF